MRLRLRARSETLCGFAIPLWRASESLLSSATRVNILWFQQQPAPVRWYTQHNILLLHNAHSLSRTGSYSFQIVSHLSNRSLSRLEIMRPIKMLLFALYTTRRLVYLFHAHSHYLYWFIVAAAAAKGSQRLLTFPSLKCQPPLINRPCLVSMANNALIRNTHVCARCEIDGERVHWQFSVFLLSNSVHFLNFA